MTEATRVTIKSVRKTSRSSFLIRVTSKKRPTVTNMEKNKASNDSNSKKVSYVMKETHHYHVLPPFLYKGKNSAVLFEECIKNNIKPLPKVEFLK